MIEGYDFSGMIRIVETSRLSWSELSYRIGVSRNTFLNIKAGLNLPSTDALALIAGYFQVGFNELVTFTDVEIKDKFKEPYYRPYEQAKDIQGVSYMPLRVMFYNFYGEKEWKAKLSEFFNKVPALKEFSHDAVKKNMDKLLAAKGVERNGGKSRKDWVSGSISPSVRSKIRNDESINLKILHNMCKVLGCTPDYIASYK